MKQWEFQALSGSLKALEAQIKYSHKTEHDTILEGLTLLDIIIKGLDNFDIEKEDK